MSLFQGILLGVFIIATIGGVVLFGIVQNDDGYAGVELSMWGTVPSEQIIALLNQIYSDENQTAPRIKYVYKSPDTFDQEFLEALASGVGPDMVLLPQQDIFKQSKRLYPIPYKTLSARTFKDTFIQEGELFLNNDGVIAVPFIIDPLVMYWNRTMFTKAGIARPPMYWDEVVQIVPRLSEKDSSGYLRKSGVALGEFSNISYAKDILSALLMQAGTPIIGYKDINILSALLDERGSFTVTPADTAITFFIQFANPVKALYSWSRAFPVSVEHFASGDVAMLFAKASDIVRIQEKNPNLNFDVGEFPKPRDDASGAITYGDMYSLAIVNNTPNTNAAIEAIFMLVSPEIIKIFEEITGLPPVRRDLLAVLPEDPYKSVFYNAALRTRGWFDPDKIQTEIIFRNMIETVVSGREGVGAATKLADEELNLLLDRTIYKSDEN